MQAAQAEVLIAFEAWRLQLPQATAAAADPGGEGGPDRQTLQDASLAVIGLLTADQINAAEDGSGSLDDAISRTDCRQLMAAALLVLRGLLSRAAKAERSTPLALLQQLAAEIIG